MCVLFNSWDFFRNTRSSRSVRDRDAHLDRVTVQIRMGSSEAIPSYTPLFLLHVRYVVCPPFFCFTSGVSAIFFLLHHLAWKYHKMKEEEWKWIADNVEGVSQTLVLHGIDIPDVMSACALAGFIPPTRFESMWFDGNNLTKAKLGPFLDLLPSPRLKSLIISNNPIGDSGVMDLVAILPQCKSLETLALNNVNMTDCGARFLFGELHRTNIESLDLSGNRITDKGFGTLNLSMTHLTSLHMRDTDVECKWLYEKLEKMEDNLREFHYTSTPQSCVFGSLVAEWLEERWRHQ